MSDAYGIVAGSSNAPGLPAVNLPTAPAQPPTRVSIDVPKQANVADQFPDYQPAATANSQQSSVADQFPAYQGPTQPAPQEQPQTDSLQRLAIDFNNQQQAAGQKTSPVMSAQAPNLLGPATVDEAGNIGYKDAQGNFVPTDQNQHVVLTDPNDNTPKVYARTPGTDESTASALGRLLGTGMAAGNIEISRAAPVAVQAADRLGVSVPKAIATNSPITKFTGQLVAKAPGGGPLAEAIPKSVSQLQSATANVAEKTGGIPDAASAGHGFSQSVENYFKPAAKSASSAAYENLSKLVDPNKTTALDNTQAAIADITARRLASGTNDVGKAVQTVLGGATRKGGLTFDGIKDLRTRVGEMLDTGIFPEGMSQSELRRIYGALSDDLTAAAKNAGGDRAVAALKKANDLHSKLSDWKETLKKVLGPSSRSGEGVTQAIIRMAQTGASADQNTLAAARAAVPAEVWRDISATAISGLGRSRNGEWSPAAFLTDYRNLSDQGKRILFGSIGRADIIPALNDIAEVSNKFVQAGKLANTSGTAGHNVAYAVAGSVLTGLAHGSFVEPLVAVSGITGINVLARILASPATASSLARWSRVYLRMAQNPGPASVAAFNRVSGELAKTVNGAFGTTITPSSLLRAVQSPSSSNAGTDQQEIPRPPSQ